MKHKSFVGKTLVLAILLFCGVAAFYLNSTPAHSSESATNQRSQIGIAYAQLVVLNDDQVTWDPGGNNLARTETLDSTYRRLGGSQRTSFVNLLNVIGNNGWELVTVSSNVWTFKQRR